MFDVHIVDATNADLYDDVMDQYFRVRHDIYIEEFRWPGLTPRDGLEIDQFDGPDATYLLGINGNGDVVAASRFIPTTKPHLLSDVFPWLADEPVPVSKDIYEWTRIFVTRKLRTSGRPSDAAGRILTAIQEFFVQTNIRCLTVVCEDFWFDRLRRLGWNPIRLGMPQEHEGEMLVALMLHMTPEALEQTRRFYGLKEPVILAKAVPPQIKSIPA